MKNQLFILFALLSIISLRGQVALETNFSTGYDHNIFRVPAFFVNSEGDIIDDIQQNGVFSQLGLATAYEWTLQKHKLGFKGNASARVYFGNEEQNLYKGALSQAYEFKVNKKWKLYQKFRFRRNLRNGLDENQELFSIPQAYRQYSFLLGGQWKPNRDFYTKLELGKRTKIYDPGEQSSLRYEEWNIRWYSRKKLRQLDWADNWESQLKFQHRNYLKESYSLIEDWEEEGDFFEEDMDDIFEDFSESDFQMQYLSGKLGLKLLPTADFSLKPYLEWTNRTGSNPRFTYFQVKPGLLADFEKGKTKITLRSSYGIRNYSSLEVGFDNWLLRYQYWTTKLDWSQELGGQWTFNTTLSTTKRFSNFDDSQSRFFRPYTTGSAMMGLRWKIE